MKGVLIRGPLVVIFMGVAGSGKTTVGTAFCRGDGRGFLRGRRLSFAGKRGKMRRGVPLTDADRAEWLAALRRIIGRSLASANLR